CRRAALAATSGRRRLAARARRGLRPARVREQGRAILVRGGAAPRAGRSAGGFPRRWANLPRHLARSRPARLGPPSARDAHLSRQAGPERQRGGGRTYEGRRRSDPVTGRRARRRLCRWGALGERNAVSTVASACALGAFRTAADR